VRVFSPDGEFVGASQRGDGGGFAGAGNAGDDQAAACGYLSPVEHDQPAGAGDHLGDRRCVDHDEFGQVVDACVVVA
jgi:hypothetical protein